MSAPERIWAWSEGFGDVYFNEWVGDDDLCLGSYAEGSNQYILLDVHQAAIAAARAEGVREGMLKAAEIADNWLATFGQVAIKHTPAQEYACDAVADIADAIRAEAQP